MLEVFRDVVIQDVVGSVDLMGELRDEQATRHVRYAVIQDVAGLVDLMGEPRDEKVAGDGKQQE